MALLTEPRRCWLRLGVVSFLPTNVAARVGGAVGPAAPAPAAAPGGGSGNRAPPAAAPHTPTPQLSSSNSALVDMTAGVLRRWGEEALQAEEVEVLGLGLGLGLGGGGFVRPSRLGLG